MYRKEPYTGSDLPSKTLCLTYDDGPGKDTYEIAKFLHEQNIRATFFVVGKYAFHQTDIIEKVAALGHLIGNHTYEHPDMPYYLSKNGDVQNQVIRTDAIIKKYSNNGIIYFRSPYGKWSKEVADELNLNVLSVVNHVGPINWDVGGIDCYYWKNERSVEDTVQRYLEDIKRADKGIIVMHDEIADMEFLKESNKTLELTKQLIPILKQEGYKFVGLDEIESIRKDASDPFRFFLKSTTEKRGCLGLDKSNALTIVEGKPTFNCEMKIEDLRYGKVALRSSNGFYLGVQVEKGCVIEAVSSKVKEDETFDLIPVVSNKIMLRAFNGNYLTRESNNGGRISATAQFMRGAEIFAFSPVSVKLNEKTSFSEKCKSLIRQFLYVKSKIQERL